MINRIFVNGIEILKKYKKGRCSILLLENGEELNTSPLYGQKIQIECQTCKIRKEVKLYPMLFKKNYVCQTCNKLGEKNPFYNKKHKQEFKDRLSRERKGVWGNGEKNSMYSINL
jgi:hypothetical protein